MRAAYRGGHFKLLESTGFPIATNVDDETISPVQLCKSRKQANIHSVLLRAKMVLSYDWMMSWPMSNEFMRYSLAAVATHESIRKPVQSYLPPEKEPTTTELACRF